MPENESDQHTSIANEEDIFSAMHSLGNSRTVCEPIEDIEPISERDVGQILEAVREGRLQPGEADEWAVRHRLAPFSQPGREVDIWQPTSRSWSLEMVASWIIWGNRELTLRQIAESYNGSRVWVDKDRFKASKPFETAQPNISGYRLETFGPTNIFMSFVGYDGRTYSFDPHDDWRLKLIGQTIHQNIHAIGRNSEDVPIPVSAEDWDRGDFVCHNGETALAVDGVIKFTRLEFQASEVLRIFPEKTPSKPRPTGLRRWLVPTPQLTAKNAQLLALLLEDNIGGVPRDRDKTWTSNLQVKAEAHDAINLKWDNPESFSRFLNRLLNTVCEPSIGRGRPPKTKP